jgi:thymidylate kinase
MSNRNKFIIGINGIDNTGKSTLVDLVNQDLSQLDEDIVYIPPHFSKLTDYFPKRESDVVDWLKNAPRQQVVRGILDGSVKRNSLIQASEKPYILLDRGYFSILASSMARLNNQREGISRVLTLAAETGFENAGELSFLLECPLSNSDMICLLEGRNDVFFEKDYVEYLSRFRDYLLEIFPQDGKRLNLLGSPEQLVSQVFNSLNDNTDLRYRLALHDFLAEIQEDTNIRTILLTGSLSTNSVQIGWSDIDLLCVTHRESDRTGSLLKDRANSVKRQYDIDMTPWIVNYSDMNDVVRKQGKIRYVLFGKSETKCVYGTNDYSGLVSQGLVSELSMDDATRLFEAGNGRLEEYKKGTLPLSKLYIKNLKMCFNVVKSILLGEGIFCPTYQDIYTEAKKKYPAHNFEYLSNLIEQKLNFYEITTKEMTSNIERQIGFSSNFLNYIQKMEESK